MYLKAIFHEIHQAGLKFTAGVEAVQITRMKLLGIKLSIALQIQLPLALINNRKFFFGVVLG